MELNAQIKKYRSSLNLSQEELAEKLYVTRQTISNWENEKNYPDLSSLKEISNEYGISFDELFSEPFSLLADCDIGALSKTLVGREK